VKINGISEKLKQKMIRLLSGSYEKISIEQKGLFADQQHLSISEFIERYPGLVGQSTLRSMERNKTIPFIKIRDVSCLKTWDFVLYLVNTYPPGSVPYEKLVIYTGNPRFPELKEMMDKAEKELLKELKEYGKE
jgi:hypothetical protein